MSGVSQRRPWGSWHVLDEADGFKVKRIEVAPGKRLSYQIHDHRSEHWIVVRGRATCTLGGEKHVAAPGESLYVDVGIPHRIANDGEELLVIVEVQLGSYTGEDDIVRLEDDYGRCAEEESAQ